jgi:hypothetical protein
VLSAVRTVKCHSVHPETSRFIVVIVSEVGEILVIAPQGENSVVVVQVSVMMLLREVVNAKVVMMRLSVNLRLLLTRSIS